MRWWRSRSEADFAAEIRTHLDLQAEELTHEGHSDVDARALARRAFGNVTIARERYFESRQVLWLEQFLQDLRYTLRQARRSSTTTILIVLTLGIGIGANVTFAGAIRELFFRPPPLVRDPEHVVRLFAIPTKARAGAVPLSAASYPTLLDLEQDTSVFESVAGVASRQLSLGLGVDATVVNASFVTDNYFTLLGVSPSVGRAFTSADGYPKGPSPGGPSVVVLSYGLWQRYFGRDPSVLGRAVHIGQLVYNVAGVMPPGFHGVDVDAPDVWIPITVGAADQSTFITLDDRTRYSVAPIARLRASVARATAEQHATRIWVKESISMGASSAETRIVAASLIRARGPDAPHEVKVTLWLGGISTLVLLIACANVANLLLGRALSRRHEIAVRLAIGAGRWRLARQMLTESMLLALAGAAAALCLAAASGPLLTRLVLHDRSVDHFFDPALVGIAAAVALGTGVLIGVAPMLQCLRRFPTDVLGTGAVVNDRLAKRLRHGLLALQSGVCMILLVGATLFSLSLRRAIGLDLGMDSNHTVRALMNFDNLLVPNDELQAIYSRMLQSVRSIPGVTGAALASSDPFSAGRAVSARTATHDGDYFWPPTTSQIAIEAAVGDGFFSAVGATSLRGRDFGPGDGPGAPPVVIINAPLAHILFPGEDALGQCVKLPARTTDHNAPCATVVGVLKGVFYVNLTNRDKPMAYVPLAQRTGYDGVWRPQGVFIRVRGEPGSVVADIRRALQSVRSDLPAVRITLMRDIVAAETRPWRLGAAVFAMYGGVALIVAIIGLYGVVSFAVSMRSFEIAVRLALGARSRDIVRLVSVDGLGAVAAGVFAGACVALSLRHAIGPLLFETTADDPRIILGIAALLLFVGSVAILFPTARALRIDAATALRKE